MKHSHRVALFFSIFYLLIFLDIVNLPLVDKTVVHDIIPVVSEQPKNNPIRNNRSDLLVRNGLGSMVASSVFWVVRAVEFWVGRVHL